VTEREVQQLVLKHLTACCEEAKSRAQYAQYEGGIATPAGAGLVAMHVMLTSCAWSLGSSLASNGIPDEPFLSDMLREVLFKFGEGYAQPGAGHML